MLFAHLFTNTGGANPYAPSPRHEYVRLVAADVPNIHRNYPEFLRVSEANEVPISSHIWVISLLF